MLFFFLICTSSTFSGELFSSLYLDYYRYTDLQGISEADTLGFHTYSGNTRNFKNNNHPWSEHMDQRNAIDLTDNSKIEISPVTTELSWNSFNLKRGTSDGLQWQGKGLNSYFSAGLAYDSTTFSVSLLPEFAYAENREYDLYKGEDDYSYFYSGIDYPTRMGDDPYTQYSPGQSEVRANYGIFTLAVSHENMVWGPSIFNPLIMSAAGEGFYHTDLGIKKTRTKWGIFEARIVHGMLEESDFFNSDSDDDKTFFTGYMLAWKPNFNSFFTVGINRSLICDWEDINGSALTKIYSFAYVDQSLGSTDDKTDQRASLWFDWKYPDKGTNIYLEIFKEDHSQIYDSLLYYPEHTAGFSFGGQQIWPLSKVKGLSFNAEYSWMQLSNSYQLKNSSGATYYVHHYADHGYTHKGQLLGAPSGPGSDAQYVALSYFDTWGLIKLYGSRINYDKDYVFLYFEDQDRLNAELRTGFSSLVFLPLGMELNLDMSYQLVAGQAFAYETFDHGFSLTTGLTYRY